MSGIHDAITALIDQEHTLPLTQETTQPWPFVQRLFAKDGYFPGGLTITAAKLTSPSADTATVSGTTVIGAMGLSVEATFSGSGNAVDLDLSLCITLAKLTGDGSTLRVEAEWQPKVTFKSNGGDRTFELNVARGVLHIGSVELTASLEMPTAEIMPRRKPGTLGLMDGAWLSATMPGPQIVAKVRPDKQLLSTVTDAHALGEVGALSLEEIRLTADPWSGTYSLAVEAGGDWEVLSKCHLTEVSALLVYSSEDGITSARLHAAITLGKVALLVAATHDAAASGWHFEGSLAQDAELDVGTFVADVMKQLDIKGECPEALRGAMITRLSIALGTAAKDLAIRCEASMPVRGGRPLDITLDIYLDGLSTNFHGTVQLGSLLFDLVFDAGEGSRTLLASYTDTEGGEVTLGDLIAPFLDKNDTTDQSLVKLTENASFSIKDAFFAYESRGDDPAHWLLAADVEAGVDFSGLPVVGASFPPGQGARLLFQPLITSGGINSTGLESLVQRGGLTLPSPLPGKKGFSITTRVALAAEEIRLGLPVGMSDGKMQHEPQAEAEPAPPEVARVDDVSWMAVQKSFGPLALERLGVRYHEGTLGFLLDAHLSAAGLSLALQGFGAEVNVANPRRITTTLDGIALDFSAPGIEIGGSLLRQNAGADADKPDDVEYLGTAVIKAGALTIDAIGSYRTVDGHPSLFVYAALDYPIGGPSFFFVTGLAAAFGYNRAFKLPPIEKLASFPLLADGVGKGDVRSASALRAASVALREYIPPELGAVFLGVGIKFSSFQTISSSALLTASFGKEVAISLIGRSELVMPAGVTRDEAVAVVEMAWLASYRPDDGLLALRAQLSPGSYIFSRDCQLAGGFAFHSWFSGKHEGQFVLTLGGYHPEFDLASRPHFPKVPRVSIAWHKDAVSIKGDAYYALTSSAAMLGGHLEILWEKHPYKAWLKAGIDCLFEWQPLHYKGEAYVELGASYTFELAGTRHITIEIGANLTVWGPPFSGRARVNLVLFSFDVAFGSAAAEPPPVHLFHDDEGGNGRGFSALLPEAGKCCTVSVKGGLSRFVEADKVWVVDPKALCLVVDSVIPAKRIHAEAMPPGADPGPDAGALSRFGIAPMQADHDDVVSETTIIVTKLGGTAWQPKDLCYRRLTKGYPAALWGERKPQGVRGKAGAADETLVQALAGVEIRPGEVKDTGASRPHAGAELHERHRPALSEGVYDIQVTQRLGTKPGTHAHADDASRQLVAKASLRFEVPGEHTSLPASCIHGVFPPQGSLGDHATSLPQIILERSTLPWECQAEVEGADENTPWLALLVFDGEKKAVADEKATQDAMPGPARITVSAAEIPTALELKRLCHVRVTKGPGGAERAVVVARRPASLGRLSTAHLVSLRGMKVTGTTCELISLHSWSFSCPAGGAGFRSLVESVAKACILGTTERLGYASPDGQRTVADYRGPLVPISSSAAGRLAKGAASSGRPDISHAAAQEIGRLLALENKSVSVGLLRLKRSLAQAARHESQARAAEHLHPRRPTGATTGAPLSGRLLPTGLRRLLTPELAAWTEGLLKLEGVPFRYLLPDERQLPKESLRSFALDERWLANLLVGALGVGGTWTLDETATADLPGFKQAMHAGADPVGEGERPFGALPRLTGIVLRSELVSGWPAMGVVADDNLAPLVTRRCSKNILLVLFQGTVKTVSFRLPPETLHFEARDQGKPGEGVPGDWLKHATSSVDLGPCFDLAKQEEVPFEI